MRYHWKPYYTMTDVLHEACATLIICVELKALIELDHEDWARKMQILLRRTCHAINLATLKAWCIPLKPRLIARIELALRTPLWRSGLAFHQALPPLRAESPNAVARTPDGSATISSCALINAEATCCGFCMIRACPSPTIRLKPMPQHDEALRQKILQAAFRAQASADDFANHPIHSPPQPESKSWNISSTPSCKGLKN